MNPAIWEKRGLVAHFPVTIRFCRTRRSDILEMSYLSPFFNTRL